MTRRRMDGAVDWLLIVAVGALLWLLCLFRR